MLRNMLLSIVYSPTVGLSEHMSAFGKVTKLIFVLDAGLHTDIGCMGYCH